MKCCRCKEDKAAADFYRDKSRPTGFSSRCKPCAIRDSARNQRDNPNRPAYLHTYYKNNRDVSLRAARERYLADPQKVIDASRRWRQANPAKHNKLARRYALKNPEKRTAWLAKYRAGLLNATPQWLNQAHLAEIEGVYHFAKVMERITGQKHHVDHIEPLQGADVSGLHVPWNLRAIPARDNVVKGNRRVEVH